MNKMCGFLIGLFSMLTMSGLAQGKVSVTVTTNVNSFECKCLEDNFVYKDTFVAATKKSVVLFPLKHFDCPKKLMEKELLDLFEADQFPYAKLKIVTIENGMDTAYKFVTFTLTLKDKTQQYKVPLKEEMLSGKLFLRGNETILLSSYGIEPPTKMFGMVKVANEVAIAFSIPASEILTD